MPDLSIVIVNWNTRDSLLNCLGAVKTHLPLRQAGSKGVNYEIVVVDNASEDGSAEAVALQYPTVRLIQNEANLGFARAVNRGINEATGKYILSLNSDTRVTPGSLETLVKFLDEHLEVGLAGAQLLKTDGRLQHSWADFPTVTDTLFNKFVLRLLFPKKSRHPPAGATVPFEVESVVGACMLLRPEALKQVGLFDDDYFVFLEETDLCRRLRRNNWKVMVVPEAMVYHFQGETKKQVLIPARIEYLNSLYKYFRKNRAKGTYWLIRIVFPLRLLLQVAFTALGCALTLGLVRFVRRQCYIYARLLLWHLLWCPGELTLQGYSERLRKAPKYTLIKWKVTDPHLERADLPTRLDRQYRPSDAGFRWVGQGMTGGQLTAPGGNGYLLKIYHQTGARDWLKRLAGHNPAAQELAVGRRMAYLGIPVVATRAIGRSRKLPGLPPVDLVLTNDLKDAQGLGCYLTAQKGKGLTPRLPLRRQVLRAAGDLFRRMHQRGLFWADFDPDNLLIQFKPGSEEFQLLLSNYTDMQLFKSLELNQQLGSLARLSRRQKGLNNSDRLMFLRAYLNTDNRTVLKTWIKQVSEIQERLTDQPKISI